MILNHKEHVNQHQIEIDDVDHEIDDQDQEIDQGDHVLVIDQNDHLKGNYSN